MAQLIFKTNGDIFDESVGKCIVNPVNCHGVMGAGLAKIVKQKFPEVFDDYYKKCKLGEMQIGKIKFHKVAHGRIQSVISLPTKDHWKDDSEVKYIEKGLDDLVDRVNEAYNSNCGFYYPTIELPALGCGCGGLDWDVVRPIMFQKLSPDRFLCDYQTIIVHYPR